MKTVRVGVVGVGHLGQHHARLLASMDGVALVGICDTNLRRAQEISAKFGGQVFADSRDLLGRVDAVSVAVPTIAHVEIALPFLGAGIATLVLISAIAHCHPGPCARDPSLRSLGRSRMAGSRRQAPG